VRLEETVLCIYGELSETEVDGSIAVDNDFHKYHVPTY